MFVLLTLNFRDTYWGGSSKRNFWANVEAKRLGKGGREVGEFDPSLAERYEAEFRTKFPQILERMVNDEIYKTFSSRLEEGKTEANPPKVKIRLVTVQYGSIEPIFDVIGIQSSDLRDFVLLALGVYAPPAFNQAMGWDINLSGTASILGNVPSVQTETKGLALTSRSSDLAGRAWMIANSSLVVPVLLSLFVLYLAFNELSSQASDLKAERTKIVDAMSGQNKAISDAIVEQAKQGAMTGKAVQDALMGMLKEKVGGKPSKP